MLVDKEQILSDVLSNDTFWFCNGHIARNIYELVNYIEQLNDFGWKYHVNKNRNKNDFARWIGLVLGDKPLGEGLRNVYHKEKYVKIIRTRIKQLERLLMKEKEFALKHVR